MKKFTISKAKSFFTLTLIFMLIFTAIPAVPALADQRGAAHTLDLQPQNDTASASVGQSQLLTQVARLDGYAAQHSYTHQQVQTVLVLTIGSTSYTRNGWAVTSDAAPFIDHLHDRTMVPLRLIAEGLGARVDWDDHTRTVHISHGHIHLSLHVDSALPGGIGMPAIRNGRTFVPVRYVSEALGAEVFWDGDTRSVTVTYTEWPMFYVAQHDHYIPLPLEDPVYEDGFLGTGALDPEPFRDTGEWSPYYRNQLIGGYWFTSRGWRISEASFWEKYAERERILAQIIRSDMSDFDKIRAVHNWLAENVSYNTDVFSMERFGGWNPSPSWQRYEREHQSAWSALILRTTVCAGYSDAFWFLLYALDIASYYIHGPVIHPDGSRESHAWNLVQLNGNWYHVDVTWNRRQFDGYHLVVYDWFLISDNTARTQGRTTRTWDTDLFPAARLDFSMNRPSLIFDHSVGRWRVRVPEDDMQFTTTTSASPQTGGTVTANPQSERPDQWVRIEAHPNTGYAFSHWEVVSGGITLEDTSRHWNNFRMPAADVSHNRL